jgi:dCTP deaminase
MHVAGGGILTGPQILKMMKKGCIKIDPFNPDHVGPNSVDLHLGDDLFTYGGFDDLHDLRVGLGLNSKPRPLDPKDLPPLVMVPKTNDGRWLLSPGRLYLGSTKEWTKTDSFVPVIDGRSSLGRLGVFAHITAGRGDDGFEGRWTVEIAVIEPVILEPGGRYFQITYHSTVGERRPYRGRYQGDDRPMGSKISEP